MTSKNVLMPHEFCTALVSALVLRGENVIEPKNPRHIAGFHKVLGVIESRLEELEGCGTTDVEILRPVVQLRNHLMPSNSGAFDQLETTLRDLQTSAIMSPNPDYEELIFELSPPFAKGVLDELASSDRRLVENAALAFVAAKNEDASLPSG